MQSKQPNSLSPDWALVIASGPSLTRADCDLLRGRQHTIAVNCAVFFAPWADELYACDQQWWNYYGPKIQWYKGRRISRSKGGPNCEQWRGKGWPRTGGNSGHQSLCLAVERGYNKVALLGFDHTHTGGKTHFHGDHPRTKRVRLGNAGSVHHWVKQMDRTAIDLERMGVEVVNVSRETALRCFPRMTVEDYLEKL